ncbi:MAG: NAD-dependent epimerase/dehydratase family protein [Elusimicrobia bacterium]|nr:NAD-dependent epimerase/dehydratase family protein [Elusimicrobiota bacterium]
MPADPICDLVTGGAGFIGSHLVGSLVGQGRRVRVVDDLSTGDERRLDGVASRIELVRADLATADLRTIMEGVERVFHLAAVPSVPRSVRDPVRSHHASATATLRLLTAARDAGVRRVVLSSSSSVYGDTAVLPKHEGIAPSPVSPYGVAKLAAEGYGRVFARLFGLSTVALRYFNVFGPSQDPSSEYAAVIPLFVTRALSDAPVTVFGDGEQTRDFTYVENAVQANLAAAEAAIEGGRAYNIAAGSPVSVNGLIAAIERTLGRPVRVEHRQPRVGDILHSSADVTAAARDLGWRPTVRFDEGIRRTIAWYRERAASAHVTA